MEEILSDLVRRLTYDMDLPLALTDEVRTCEADGACVHSCVFCISRKCDLPFYMTI